MSSEEREDGAALGMHTFQIVNDWRPRLHRKPRTDTFSRSRTLREFSETSMCAAAKNGGNV